MMFLFVVFVLFFLFLFVVGKGYQYRMEHDDFVEPEVKPYKMNVKFDLNHYTEKHLHRDDEKHARHKRNQTPW